jgi:archaellum component FlaC
MATTIETDLREVLAKIDNRLERIENDLTEFKTEIQRFRYPSGTKSER